jgi:cyclase
VTLLRRVIVCLDVRRGRVVKGVQFRSLRDVGDPVELAARYEAEGADEVTFLDIDAASLTIGGGIRSAADVALALRSGADKVALNTAAVARPDVLTEAAERFGAQCVVASIDALREGTRWMVYTHGGKRPAGLDAIEWARACVARGAGEILLTSIDRDGSRAGYDLELTRAVVDAVGVPVIASGGAGHPTHCREAVSTGGADAALVAGIVHDGDCTVADIKAELAGAGIPVRKVA